MPGKAAKIPMTERQLEILKSIRDAKTSPKHLAQRATIIVMGFEKRTNQEIAQLVGLERHQVGHWRKRWQEQWHRLMLLEGQESAAGLKRALSEALSDLPRAGSPGTFTPEQITQILALACESPEKSGRPISSWTHNELAAEAIQRGIVETISATQVGRFLREANLKPHKSRYWLNAKQKEKDPQAFEEQVQEVCQCYQDAPNQFQEHGRHTVCVDEMTGLQALERAAPTKPVQPGCPERREHEYIRHGTQTLIGSFEVASGELIQTSVGPTRKEQDFLEHIQATVALDPEAEWVFVMDQLNIHQSESLVCWIADQIGFSEPLGKKREVGNFAIAVDSPSLSFGSGAPNPDRVCSETHVLVESD